MPLRKRTEKESELVPYSSFDPQEIKGLFALFKGESGSGKTVAALSFPEPFVLDHDLKMPAIARKHYKDKKVDYEVFDNAFAIDATVDWMVNFYPYINEKECYDDKNNWRPGFSGINEFPYETVICDTLTSLSQAILNTVDQQKGQSVYTSIKKINTSAKGAKSFELRSYDSYNAEDMALKLYIDEMKFLWARPGNPKHVIVCAHILSHTKGGNQVRRLVTAGNNIGQYIPAQFDEMYHFVSEQSGLGSSPVRRMVYTEQAGEDNAKTAYDLPPKFDITDETLYDKISKFVNIGKGEEFITDQASNYK